MGGRRGRHELAKAGRTLVRAGVRVEPGLGRDDGDDEVRVRDAVLAAVGDDAVPDRIDVLLRQPGIEIRDRSLAGERWIAAARSDADRVISSVSFTGILSAARAAWASTSMGVLSQVMSTRLRREKTEASAGFTMQRMRAPVFASGRSPSHSMFTDELSTRARMITDVSSLAMTPRMTPESWRCRSGSALRACWSWGPLTTSIGLRVRQAFSYLASGLADARGAHERMRRRAPRARPAPGRRMAAELVRDIQVDYTTGESQEPGQRDPAQGLRF
jgi:hypothetical protein